MDRRERALELIAHMLPDSMMARSSTSDLPPIFAGDITELSISHSYTDLWTREGLDLRTRSIATVAMMIAVRDHDELRHHVPAAVRNGVTTQELEELVIHATGYVGFPAAASARAIMVESLTQAGFLDGVV